MERTGQISAYPFLMRRGTMYHTACETVDQLPIQLTSLMLTATDIITGIATDLRQSKKYRTAFAAKDIFGTHPLGMNYDFRAYDDDSDMKYASVDIVRGDKALSIVESTYRIDNAGDTRRVIALAYCDNIANPLNCMRSMNRRQDRDHLDTWTYDGSSVGLSRTLYVLLGAPDGNAVVNPTETLPFFEQSVRLQAVQNGPDYFDTVHKVTPAEIPASVLDDALIAKRGISALLNQV